MTRRDPGRWWEDVSSEHVLTPIHDPSPSAADIAAARALVDLAGRVLGPLEATLLRERYLDGSTLRAIAMRHGVERKAVRYRLKMALRRLRAWVVLDALAPEEVYDRVRRVLDQEDALVVATFAVRRSASSAASGLGRSTGYITWRLDRALRVLLERDGRVARYVETLRDRLYAPGPATWRRRGR